MILRFLVSLNLGISRVVSDIDGLTNDRVDESIGTVGGDNLLLMGGAFFVTRTLWGRV